MILIPGVHWILLLKSSPASSGNIEHPLKKHIIHAPLLS
jgi:hypothetical protein